MLMYSNLRSCSISNNDLVTHESQQWRSTLQLSSVLKGCNAVTSLSVQASASACAASAIPVKAPITGSSSSARLIPSAFLNLVAVVSSAAYMIPPALPSQPRQPRLLLQLSLNQKESEAGARAQAVLVGSLVPLLRLPRLLVDFGGFRCHHHRFLGGCTHGRWFTAVGVVMRARKTMKHSRASEYSFSIEY